MATHMTTILRLGWSIPRGEVAWISLLYSVQIADKGGRGSKNPNNVPTSFVSISPTYKGGHIAILVDDAKDEGDAPEDNFHGGNDLAMTLAAAAHIAWSASMIEPVRAFPLSDED